MLEAGVKHGFMEDFRIWAELRVTRFFDGVRFVVRWLAGVPTGDASPPAAQPRRRSQSDTSPGASAEDVGALSFHALHLPRRNSA